MYEYMQVKNMQLTEKSCIGQCVTVSNRQFS